MVRKEQLLNYFAIFLIGIITLSEVTLLLSDEQAEQTKEERELKEELKEKEGEKETILLLGGLDLASVAPYTFLFLSKNASDYLIKRPFASFSGSSLFIVFCCLKIPFC